MVINVTLVLPTFSGGASLMARIVTLVLPTFSGGASLP